MNLLPLYQLWLNLDKPSLLDLANLGRSSLRVPFHFLIGLCTTLLVFVAANYFGLGPPACPLLAAFAGVSLLFATAAIFGLHFLWVVQREYGPGTASKVLTLFRQSKHGESVNLEELLGGGKGRRDQ